MIYISNIIIPSIILIVIIYGLYKRVDIFSLFTKGVYDGLNTILSLFPTIFAMILAINIFTGSNILTDLFTHLKTSLFIPREILPLAFLRSISSSSSLMYLNYLLGLYGADSKIGMIASIIQSSTDTTIYIIGLYFGIINIKKIRHSLIIGLLTDFFCIIFAIFLVNVFYHT